MKLSICCITYNHEEYIKDALESFLAQKVDVEYEIIIADDASTDGTQSILKEYQKIYPDLIKLILREKNIGIMRNFADVLQRGAGEYLAYCDGDDYFTDNTKLAKQIKALDDNRSCSYSFHDVLHVSSSKNELHLLSKGRNNEKFHTGIVNSKKIVGSPIRLIHANALLFRREAISEFSLMEKLFPFKNADFGLSMILASRGECFYFRDVMSAYRLHDESISHQRSIADVDVYKELIRFYNVIDEHFSGKFKDEIRANKIGMNMMHLEGLLIGAADSKSIFQFIQISLQMLLICRESQYSFRSVVWIIRTTASKSMLKM